MSGGGPAAEARGPQFSVVITCTVRVGQLVSDALADAAAYRRARALGQCAACEADADGACSEHAADAMRADEYDQLAAEIADLPAAARVPAVLRQWCPECQAATASELCERCDREACAVCGKHAGCAGDDE